MSAGERYKRRWRNLLLDTRYQAAFTLPMIIITAALFGGLGYVALAKAEAATTIGLDQIEQGGAPYLADADATRAALVRRERVIRYGIVGSGIVLCTVLTLYGVVLSHRVAGPLYRLGVELAKLRDGKLAPVRPLRKKDALADLYDTYRGAAEALRRREEHDVATLRQFLDAASSMGAELDPAVLAKVRAHVQRKEAGLG